MLQLINEGKLTSMTLKLNGAAHFLTGIATTHIASGSSNQTRWRCRADPFDDSSCLLRKGVLEAPHFKPFLTQHRGSPRQHNKTILPNLCMNDEEDGQISNGSLSKDLQANYPSLSTFGPFMVSACSVHHTPLSIPMRQIMLHGVTICVFWATDYASSLTDSLKSSKRRLYQACT